MKERITSGFILVIILILILFVNIPLVDTLVVVFLSVVGMYEYNKAFKSAGFHLIPAVGYIGCLSCFLINNNISGDTSILITRISLTVGIMLIFIYSILTNLKTNILDVAVTALSLLYIPFLFSFLKLILMMDNGRLIIWFVLMGAFACDTCAYFIGSKFGKKKLCSSVSPKKTVEGSIAGIIGVVITYAIITYVANVYFGMNLNIYLVFLMAIVSSIAGQFGDLSASSIKRYCKIKDFGSIMPGHGGILDRCDSILFVAPIVYMFIKVFFRL